MVFPLLPKAATGLLVLSVVTGLLRAQSAWIQLGTPPLSARQGHVMAYDFVGQALWLHGGEGMSDFWRYDLESSTWTQQVLAIEPASTNGGHAMVFDDQKHVLWLYGGKGSLSNGEKLWKFDIANMTWSEQTHALNKPVGRKNHAMVYDSHEQMLWVFGGRMSNGNYVLENTCRYDIQTSTWRTWALDPEPAKRYSHAMAYDSESRAVWLHGGEHTTKFDDLWKLDVQTKTWSEQAPDLPKPSARRNSVLIFDSIGHRLWLHGGLTDGGRTDDLCPTRAGKISGSSLCQCQKLPPHWQVPSPCLQPRRPVLLQLQAPS